MDNRKVIILTGEVQTGKTTTLLSWIKQRNDVAGFLTPVEEGRRLFYSIPERQTYRMESVVNENSFEVGRFRFSTSQFQMANELLLEWLDETHWKWLVIDEIGPLELTQKKGFWPSLSLLLKGKFSGTIIVVVRQSLSHSVKELFEENKFNITEYSASGFQLSQKFS